MVAVTEPAQVDSGDVVRIPERRSDEIPPAGMGRMTVHKEQTRLVVVAPVSVTDACIFYFETSYSWLMTQVC